MDVPSKGLLPVALASCCKIYPDISWSPYSRILEAAWRDKEQRQSGPSITFSFLMRFDVFFWFQINDSYVALFQAQFLKKTQGNGWNLKYHGSVDAAFCVSQLLSSWPHPGCTTMWHGTAVLCPRFWKGWKLERDWNESWMCLTTQI